MAHQKRQWDLEEMLQSLQEARGRVPATGARLTDRLALQRAINRVQREFGNILPDLRNIPELEETTIELENELKECKALLDRFYEA